MVQFFMPHSVVFRLDVESLSILAKNPDISVKDLS